MQVVVGASGTLVDFVGTNYSGESTTPQLCNNALGVLEKDTGVLKIAPVIFGLEPKVRELMDAKKEETRKEEDKLMDAKKEETTKEEDNYLGRLKLWVKEMDAKKEETTKEEDKLMGKFKLWTTNKKKEYDIREGDPPRTINLEATIAIDRNNIPPHDDEATSPDMAYPLNKIIFEGDWKYLVDIFELVEAGSDVSPDVYPTFVCNRVHKIGAIKDEEKRKRMAGILSYITHLIKYKDRHGGVSSTRRHKLPSVLAQRFSSLFGEIGDQRKRYEKQQLLISYVLVLSLFADDFRSDPSDLAKDLRMFPMRLMANYGYLGCKFIKEKVLVATLSTPLEFPTRKRRR